MRLFSRLEYEQKSCVNCSSYFMRVPKLCELCYEDIFSRARRTSADIVTRGQACSTRLLKLEATTLFAELTTSCASFTFSIQPNPVTCRKLSCPYRTDKLHIIIMSKIPSIVISVKTSYLENESQPDKSHFVFAYQISIQNAGPASATLLDRHWIISDSNGRDITVTGEGVVGEQPNLEPGSVFTYTSTAVIQTPVGVMKGQYRWISEQEEYFYTQIPQFTLSIPRILH